eukprot:scaffold104578_cov67-Attheya_sp.AAC.10
MFNGELNLKQDLSSWDQIKEKRANSKETVSSATIASTDIDSKMNDATSQEYAQPLVPLPQDMIWETTPSIKESELDSDSNKILTLGSE